MKKLLFITLLLLSWVSNGQSGPGNFTFVRARDYISSYTANSNLTTYGRGSGFVDVQDTLRLSGLTASRFPYINAGKLVTGLTASDFKTNLSLNNVENTALSTWAGSTNLTTLGTIATGVWQGTPVTYAYGGTGLSALGTALQVLRTNATANAMEWATISGVTFGSATQIPYMNPGGTDFLYSSGHTFDGATFAASVTGTASVVSTAGQANLQSQGTGSSSRVSAYNNILLDYDIDNSSVGGLVIQRNSVAQATWANNGDVDFEGNSLSDISQISTTSSITVNDGNFSSTYNQLGNSTNLTGTTTSSSNYSTREVTIKPADDSGTLALYQIIGQRSGGAAVTTRPLMAGYNLTSKEWEVAANGDWNFQANTLSNFISPLIIGGTTTTSPITYKTTTANGTTGADHVFVGGNNGATEFMRILNSGRIGINATSVTDGTSFGAASQRNRLKVGGADYTTIEINSSDSDGGSLQFTYGSNAPDQTLGYLGYDYASGANSNFYLINSISGANNNYITNGAGAHIFNSTIGLAGNRVSDIFTTDQHTTNAETVDSDSTLKEKVKQLPSQLAKIAQIKPVTHEWKDKIKKDSAVHYSVLAQEIKLIYPEVVVSTLDSLGNETLGVRYQELIPPMIKAIQELQTQLAELQQEIVTLEAKNK